MSHANHRHSRRRLPAAALFVSVQKKENPHAHPHPLCPLAIAAALCAAPALADDLPTLQKIKSSGTIVVGHRESSIPFSYLDGNQKPVGYSDGSVQQDRRRSEKELKMPALVTKLTR